jgi:glycosyltransferase involved in cell wall biosynthesis
MPEPLASVVIAAYDAEATLDEQLAALSRQEAPFSWELLVCDNGSNDGTRALAEGWRDRMPWLRVIDASERRGPSAARNIGADSARGARLAFCDADDVVADGWLAHLIRALDHAEVVVGAGESALLNDPRRASVSWDAGALITKPYWSRHPAGASSNMAVDAALFRDLGGFDETLRTGEDVDLCWRIQLGGGRLAVADDAIVHLRKRVGLRAVYRQAVSYAEGDRLLREKFRREIAADADAGAPEPSPPATAAAGTAEPAHPPQRSVVGRVLRLLGPSGRADAAWRLGQWRGRRRG